MCPDAKSLCSAQAAVTPPVSRPGLERLSSLVLSSLGFLWTCHSSTVGHPPRVSSFVGPSGPRCHLPEHSSDDETLGSDTYVVECRVLFKLSMPRQGQDRAGSLSSIKTDASNRWSLEMAVFLWCTVRCRKYHKVSAFQTGGLRFPSIRILQRSSF